MNILNWADKLDDIIYAPVSIITEWAKEPLRRSQYKMDEKIKDNESRRIRETKEHDVQLEVKQQTEVAKVLSELEQYNKDRELDRKIKESEHEVAMMIKTKTEIERILDEIDQLKKDNEFNRMIAVTEAIMQFKERLTKVNLDAIASIGNMQIDLRDKAYNLIVEKSKCFKELQDVAWNDAFSDLKRIEENFADNDGAKRILTNAVDNRLANIITASNNFLNELNNDILSINQNINLLTENGQNFIERHLEQFKTISYSEGIIVNDVELLTK